RAIVPPRRPPDRREAAVRIDEQRRERLPLAPARAQAAGDGQRAQAQADEREDSLRTSRQRGLKTDLPVGHLLHAPTWTLALSYQGREPLPRRHAGRPRRRRRRRPRRRAAPPSPPPRPPRGPRDRAPPGRCPARTGPDRPARRDPAPSTTSQRRR